MNIFQNNSVAPVQGPISNYSLNIFRLFTKIAWGTWRRMSFSGFQAERKAYDALFSEFSAPIANNFISDGLGNHE